MTDLESQIIETWQINHRVNLMLLDALTEESLGFTLLPRGGGSIGHQLAHIYNVRYWHIEKIDKSLIKDSKTVKAEEEKTIEMLRELHAISADWVTQILTKSIKDNKKIAGTKRGIIPYLGNYLAHEAHHRGNILLTLKLSGFKLPNTLKYTIWDWNNI